MTKDEKDVHEFGETKLHRAAAGGSIYIEESRRLLAQGADVNLRDLGGRTALHWAVDAGIGGSVETVRALLEAGADVNAQDNIGWTPLHHLAARANPERGVEIASLLLQAGADPGITNSDGATPEQLARGRTYGHAWAERFRAAVEQQSQDRSARRR